VVKLAVAFTITVGPARFAAAQGCLPELARAELARETVLAVAGIHAVKAAGGTVTIRHPGGEPLPGRQWAARPRSLAEQIAYDRGLEWA
jgi:hypothetical protein